jgi:O-antigen/teichoic acid export membrane protein
MIGIPLCFLQAAIAPQVVRVLFDAKWYDGIRIVEILSIGIAPHVVGIPAIGAIKAQGRFRSYLGVSVVAAAAFVTLVYAGARQYGIHGAAISVAAYSWTIAPFCVYVAIRPSGGRLTDVLRIFALPLCASLGCFGVALLAGALIRRVVDSDILQLIVVTISALCLYAAVVRILDPTSWSQLTMRIRSLRKSNSGEVP